MLKTHVLPCFNSPIYSSLTYSISKKWILFHLIFILFTKYIYAHSHILLIIDIKQYSIVYTLKTYRVKITFISAVE